MNESPKMPAIRSMNNCTWYWIDKKILFIYGTTLKAPGIAVYNALAAFANSKTQSCFPAQTRIAQLCGISVRTVIRKVRLLEELGLIRTEKRGKITVYYLLERPIGDNYFATCDKSYRRYVTKIHANKNNRTRIMNDTENQMDLMHYKPKTREELLAKDLAICLGDSDGFAFYLAKAKAYPEGLLRALMSEVQHLPDQKIQKCRGALFNYLLQHHAEKNRNHSGD